MSSTRRKDNRIVNLELTALSLAAKKAGMSYGKFVAQITAEERLSIILEYKEMLSVVQHMDKQ